jgi:hypothetical protein
MHRAENAAADNHDSVQLAEPLPRTTADPATSVPSVNRALVTGR